MANMFSGKDAADPSYPTQWALNPNAYQNVDSSMVDWAALAQQWIAMKDAAAILSTSSAPSGKPDVEEGEAPMEVENPDAGSESVPQTGGEWNASTNSWGTPGWNQWGWGWGQGGVDPKMSSDSSMAMAPMMDGYTVPPDGTAPMPGYTTGPTFQHGYWTAPQGEHQNNRDSSRSRDRRSKSKNRDHKLSRSRIQRDKPPLLPPVIAPVAPPPAPGALDAAKRRQLPAWIREGLEKMEREKQRAIEREQEKKAREEAEKEKKKLEELELERMKAEAGGQPVVPAKSKFESDSEGEAESPASGAPQVKKEVESEAEPDPPAPRTKEEIMQEVMFTVRRSLTEILLEVTDSEIHMVSQEELARYTAAQASRLNAMKASKSKALASIASGLGLGAYESSSDESDGDEHTDITDQQLQDIIRRKKQEFERTAKQIEAEVDSDARPSTPDTPENHRSSATPPPADSETPEKIQDRRTSRDKRNHRSNDKVDAIRRLESIPEEKKKSSRKDLTPSPPKNNHKKESSSSTSDSEGDSPTSASESESEREEKVETKSKRSRRRSSSSSDSLKKSKKHKREKPRKSGDKRSKSHRDEDKSRSKKREEYDRRKSSRSRDYERSHKDKYRDDSEEERSRKRAKRSRSVSYESRRRSRDRSRRRDRRSRSRSRDGDKHDRYERSREHDRRRESRHRR